MDICRRAPHEVPPPATASHPPYAVAHDPEDADDPFVPGRRLAG